MKLLIFSCFWVVSLLNLSVMAAEMQTNAGKTIMALGQVKAATDEGERALKRRAPIFMQDTVFTEIDSRTQLRMVDGGLLSLKEQSQLAIASYDFNPQSEQASIAMSLLKGGLRTVTGKLSQGKTNYQLNTPVASIGVRGTDYSAQLLDKELLLAVWQGAIDVQVTVGASPIAFSLGKEHEFSIAKVKANGEVEFLLQVPKALVLGHTAELVPDAAPAADVLAAQQQHDSVTSSVNHQEFELALNDYDQTTDEWIDADFNYGDFLPPSDGLSRSGSATFGLLQHSFASSLGAVQEAFMSMTVDFDSARVESGQLSFIDSQGEWFAVFNGIIEQGGLEININFAAHDNELADGSISGVFVENGSQVFGDVFLSENLDSSINAGGTFVLGESQP